jgi:hypothetical protein
MMRLSRASAIVVLSLLASAGASLPKNSGRCSMGS